jgi:hypothetical protein
MSFKLVPARARSCTLMFHLWWNRISPEEQGKVNKGMQPLSSDELVKAPLVVLYFCSLAE